MARIHPVLPNPRCRSFIIHHGIVQSSTMDPYAKRSSELLRCSSSATAAQRQAMPFCASRCACLLSRTV
jgi:hypothetical protein